MAPLFSAELVATAGADSPPAATVLGFVGLAALAIFGAAAMRHGYLRVPPARTQRSAAWRRRGAALVGTTFLLLLPPWALDEADLFRFGLVLIFIIAAAGLHVLVNWSGQLSLAHAGMIGLPAFVVGKLSFDHAISPIVLVPVGMAAGAAIGAVVALPALRVRGLYVTVITLAAGLAIQNFFFTRRWLIGPGTLSLAPPSLGWTFRTTRSLYPVLALVFILVVLGLGVLYRSKLARAFWWLKSDPDAAAAAGVNTGTYVVLAYAIAGALAALSGAMTAIWVQSVSPGAFGFALAFTYLITVVLVGPGSLAGLLVSVFVLQGIPLFNEPAGNVVGYLAPVALLIMLTRYPAGVNGLGRSARRWLTGGSRPSARRPVIMRQRVFPIADYERLSVNEVISVLDGLSDHELELVAVREQEGRPRRLVMTRLAEMRSAQPGGMTRR